MKKLFTSVLLLALFWTETSLAEQQSPAENKFIPLGPIMPLVQVKTGMKAKVRTVIEGTAVYQFDATLLGVVPRKTSPKNLIVIRVDDKYVRDSGGIAAGMSGSPVYVDGKLVGAIGYGWPFSDTNLGLVTPIEEMIKVMEWADRIPELGVQRKAAPKPEEIKPKESSLPKLLSPDVEPEADEQDDDIFIIPEADMDEGPIDIEDILKSISDDLSADIKTEDVASLNFPADFRNNIAKLADHELVPLATPLMVDGISTRMADRLKGKLGIEVIPFGASSGAGIVNFHSEPKPGSAIGVSLAWGDFQAGGIGTLTALDKNGQFLAFGHSMANRGAVAYPATEASIIKIIPSLESSFKVGYQGAIIGIVTQDRPEAIGGRLSRLALASGYTVKFHDVDDGRKITKHFQTVADPFIGPMLATTGMLGIIDDLWARVGEGTAILRYKFTGGELVKSWTRSNIYVSENDIVGEMTKEFEALAQIFALNHFREIRPFGAEVEIEVTRDLRAVFIEKLKIANEKDSYSPGDIVDLEITMRPWRKQATVKRFSLKVPEDAVGLCEIVVRGGGIEELGQDSILAGYRTITSLENLIKELNVEESNNQLIIEINSDGDLFAPANRKSKDGDERKEGDDKDSGRLSPEDLMDDRMKSEIIDERIKDQSMIVVDTNYYVDGLLRKFIMIKSEKTDENFKDIEQDIIKEELSTAQDTDDSATKDETDSGPETLLRKTRAR